MLIVPDLRACFAALSVLALCVSPAVADELTDLTGHWEGEARKDGRSFRFALDFDPHRNPSAYFDYRDAPPLYGVPFTASTCSAGLCLERRPVNGPVSTFHGRIVGNRFVGVFNGAGAQDASLELRRVSRDAVLLRETPITFNNGDVQLNGLLILPDGDGPFPAIVISHGSNPAAITDVLYRGAGVEFARHGVAALIYDKRGVGGSSGDYSTSSLHDLAGDALAGLDALSRRPDIRADAIGVAGHSQGGWIAPLAATLSPRVAFVVVTAASGLGPMAQSLHHNANEMRIAGFTDAEIAQAQDLRRRMYALARTGRVDDRFVEDIERASTQPWFEASQLPHPFVDDLTEGSRRFILFEPLPVWRQVRVPVLAAWGANDINLPAAESRDLIAQALREGGNDNVSLHVLPGLDHSLFVDPPLDAAWDFPRGSQDYAQILSDWLASTPITRNPN